MLAPFTSRKQVSALFVLVIALAAPNVVVHAIYVRDDLAQINTPGVGLDDYEGIGALYPAVGYFWDAVNLPNRGQACTGTIINYTEMTTRVLTAAHCIAPYDTNNNHVVSAMEAANLTFQLGNNGNLNGAGAAVKMGWVPAGFAGAGNPDDVAIVEINANAAAFGNVISAIAYAPFGDINGRQSDFIGWGDQGTGLADGAGAPRSVTDPFGYTAKDKLGAQNIIDSNWNGMIVTDFDDPLDANGVNPLGAAFPLNFEGTTASGDSGGPIVPLNGPAANKIVGVLSGGFAGPNVNCRTNSLYDDCSAWAPLAPNKAFIKLRAAFQPGDFNDDGVYDCSDINALTTAIASGGDADAYDLNGDGILSILDVDAWRLEAGERNIGPGRPYRPSDMNLDGVVDGTDFAIWNANKFTVNSNWCSGDVNVDGVVDGSDFILWNANKFTNSDIAISLPEPNCSLLFVCALLVAKGRKGTGM